MTKNISVSLVLVLLTIASAYAESFTGEVYTEDKSKQLYTLTVSDKTEGNNEHMDAVYKTMDGKIAFTEKTELEGGKFKSYSIEQPDAHISAKIEASGNKLLFTENENGNIKKDDDDFKDNTVVPSTSTDFIVKNWDKILKGDDVDSRFAVWDRRETVGFKFFKSGEEKRDGKDVVIVRMKPTSFIIAAILPKPVLFYLDKATRRNVEFHGRLPFKKLNNGKLDDQDGVILYHYK